MEIESPHLLITKEQLQKKKFAYSTGKKKKRKLSSKNFFVNCLDRNYFLQKNENDNGNSATNVILRSPCDIWFRKESIDSFKNGNTPRNSHYRNCNNSKKNENFKIKSNRINEEFNVKEVIIYFYIFFLKFIKFLGKGKFGKVYKCENKLDQLLYTLKILKSKNLG